MNLRAFKNIASTKDCKALARDVGRIIDEAMIFQYSFQYRFRDRKCFQLNLKNQSQKRWSRMQQSLHPRPNCDYQQVATLTGLIIIYLFLALIKRIILLHISVIILQATLGIFVDCLVVVLLTVLLSLLNESLQYNEFRLSGQAGSQVSYIFAINKGLNKHTNFLMSIVTVD